MQSVLILCTGNSARSIIGEVLIRDLGTGRLSGFSAGSQPKGAPHPGALAALARHGHSVEGLSSKSWHVFSGPDAPPIHIAITVCDNAAHETCPVFSGAPVRAHWGIEDPAAAEGDALTPAFERSYAELTARVQALLALPIEAMDSKMLQNELNRIGQMAGATHG